MSSTKLEQTKGKFKIVGKVVGIKNENAKREGFTSSEKQYKSVSFFVQTSPINKVKVELFGMEREHVYAYSNKAKETKKVAWANRHDDHKDFKVMGTTLSLETSDGGKTFNRKVLTEFDAVPYMIGNLNDGDVVRVIGEVDFQEFESQGEMKQSTKYNIKSVTRLAEELDFESDTFKEESIFEQEIVVSDKYLDDETNKLMIDAKIIKYGGEVANTTLVVDGNALPKLAKNMGSRLSFGDFIKVFGHIVNSVITKEEEVVEDDTVVADDDDWGGDNDIQKDFETNYINEYVNELQITSVDSSTYDAKRYNEEDFQSEGEDAFNGNVESGDDFGGDDDGFDDDEDLPFD